jgi:hypothetical protein
LDSGEYFNANDYIRNRLLKGYKHMRSLAIFDSCRTPKPEAGPQPQNPTKLSLNKPRGTGGTASSTGSQYMEVYGSEEGKAVKYFSTMSVDLISHVDEWVTTNGTPFIIPNGFQHLNCSTGRPIVNSRIGDCIHLGWDMGIEYPDKDEKFTGHKIDGKKEGHGELTMSDGSKYIGEFENDKFNGSGVFTWPSGDRKYIGDFFNNEMHGEGLITLKGEFEC